jgi:hypothetical protein
VAALFVVIGAPCRPGSNERWRWTTGSGALGGVPGGWHWFQSWVGRFSKASGEEPLVFQRRHCCQSTASALMDPGRRQTNAADTPHVDSCFCFDLCPNRKVRWSWQWSWRWWRRCFLKMRLHHSPVCGQEPGPFCWPFGSLSTRELLFKSVIVLTTGKSGGRPIPIHPSRGVGLDVEYNVHDPK